MCRSQMLASAAKEEHIKYGTDDEVRESLDRIVNGNFLILPKHPFVLDKISMCLSYLCLLSKEFDADYAAEGVADWNRRDQLEFLARFGAYLEVPVLTLSDLMRRLRQLGRGKRQPSFQQLVNRWLVTQRVSTSPHYPGLPFLATVLSTCFHAYNLYAKKQPVVKLIPWEIHVSSRGCLQLRYHYLTRKNGKYVRAMAFYVIAPEMNSKRILAGLRNLNQLCHAERKI